MNKLLNRIVSKRILIFKNGTFPSLFAEPNTIVLNEFMSVSIQYDRWEQRYLINHRGPDFSLLQINETETEDFS